MTGKYQEYVCHIWSAARFLAFLISAARRDGFSPRLSAYPFGFCDQEPADSRLRPANVPQPGVVLVTLTAPARSLARSVSTAECQGLLLLRSVLVQNSRCGVSIKEARKEWHPPKEVLNSANIEGRDKRGLVQLHNTKPLCSGGRWLE